MKTSMIVVFVSAILLGTAFAQQKDDYASCASAEECKSNCCLNNIYCSPLVNGSCSSQNLTRACGNPQTGLARLLCPLITRIIGLIPNLTSGNNSAVTPTLLRTLTGLLNSLGAALGGTNLAPLLQSVNSLLGGLENNTGSLLGGLNTLIAGLLSGLVG